MRKVTPTTRTGGFGFSLVELAVVMAIVALLLGTMMVTLSAQTDQRNSDDTRRRLDQARELLLTYAIVNGRLPCPARSNSTGFEVRISEIPLVADSGKCKDAATAENYYGGDLGGGVTGGFLPAATIGFQQVDSGGFAVDAWGNRIRYAVANLITNCSGTSTTPHFTYATNLKANGISCQPNDLLICKSANDGIHTITPTACGGAANQIMSQSLVVAIIYSTGKNGSTGGGGIDEAANLNGDRVFVWHTPTPSTFANGEFDDQMTWITVGEFYGRLISAGVLP